MIRQELMDNVEQLTDVLNGALSINPPADIKNCINDALNVAMNIADLVSKQLEDQRQEQSEFVIGLDDFMTIEELETKDPADFVAYKQWCEQRGLKPSHGLVLNAYFKEKGV